MRDIKIKGDVYCSLLYRYFQIHRDIISLEMLCVPASY